MKLFVLILLLGLGCADLNIQNCGPWQVEKLGASNKGKISVKSPLVIVFWRFICKVMDCDGLFIELHVNSKGNCLTWVTPGNKEDSETYKFYYRGSWSMEFCYQSENSMILCLKHSDLRGGITYMVELLVRFGKELTNEDNEEFKKMLEKYNIPKNSVLDISRKDA